MPEYMTKSEPVDKKPYIVYTDEKGILYSGDPDSDIPGGGGGGTHKVYLFQQSQGSTVSSLDLSVKDWNNQAVSVYETEIEGPEGSMTVGCFDSTDGVQYQIERTSNPHITGAECVTYQGGSSINCKYDTGIVFYTAAATDVIMLLEL